MDTYEAVASRRSVRAFLPTPVDAAAVRRVLQAAAYAPSGGNLQPWHVAVVAGEPLAALKAAIRDCVAAMPAGEPQREYDIYPSPLPTPYRERRYQVGEDMYRAIGVPREDKAARYRWRERNFDFFGAPLALLCWVDRRMGPPQWSDLGMYLQTVMLLLRAEGLDSCAQEIWSMFPAAIAAQLAPPPEHMLFCGMAIGNADTSHPINAFRSARAHLDVQVRWFGFPATPGDTQ